MRITKSGRGKDSTFKLDCSKDEYCAIVTAAAMLDMILCDCTFPELMAATSELTPLMHPVVRQIVIDIDPAMKKLQEEIAAYEQFASG